MNVNQLVEAIARLDTHDALRCRFGLEGWKLLAPYLSMRFLQPGQVLMREGESEREIFMLAQGLLHAQVRSMTISSMEPGSVVGEGTFFSGQPRSATIISCGAGVTWSLSWERYEAMSVQYPKLSLDLTKGLAAVLAVRMRAAILVGQFT